MPRARLTPFRAYDSKTGRELWSTKLGEVAHSVPITYQGNDGRQYVAVTTGTDLKVFRLGE